MNSYKFFENKKRKFCLTIYSVAGFKKTKHITYKYGVAFSGKNIEITIG